MHSIRELYRIGKGPSSSHTIGPERACRLFLKENSGATVQLITNVGPVIGSHSGPGTLALFFLANER